MISVTTKVLRLTTFWVSTPEEYLADDDMLSDSYFDRRPRDSLLLDENLMFHDQSHSFQFLHDPFA